MTVNPDSRQLYARVADPELPLPGGALLTALHEELRTVGGEELRTVGGEEPRTVGGEELRTLVVLQQEAAEWSAAEAARFAGLLEQAPDVLVRRAVLACAPVSLVSGAWLQWLSAPASGDDPLALRVLAVYAEDVAVGHPGASRGCAYRELLRRLCLAENAAAPARLARDQRLGDAQFYLPAVLLTMSRRPEDFLPEIVGADLCLRTVGLLPPLAAVREHAPSGTDWSRLDPSAARESGRDLTAEVRAIAEDLPADRVLDGFRWALVSLRRWSAALRAELAAACDPAFEMAELLRLRAREGAVYHRDFPLAGRPLAEWLAEARTDPSALLKALASSKLVKPGAADRSPLVNGLVSERGRMFRVFSTEDLTVIRRWIDSLPGDASRDADPPAAAAPTVPSSLHKALDDGWEGEDAPPADIRDAYHRMLRRTSSPALDRWAMAYVHSWLGRARYRLDQNHPLPARWSPEGLRPWLADQHDRHGDEFEATAESPLPSREDLIDSTVQLAPLTLIDGGWLQGFTDYEHASSDIGYSLFETYWDELGNGDPALNHPLIYREVLAEMGVELPPTRAREFAQWDGFRDESFELPVYWLCVGRFPRTFQPEILGLNLAMELSGVGGTYRRARIALKTYGFSTRFVDIHNTIDNVATGHSAWAADAVDTFLATAPASRGEGSQAELWERVRAGYRSLNPPSSFGARLAGRRARHRSLSGASR